VSSCRSTSNALAVCSFIIIVVLAVAQADGLSRTDR
jgi:hypothetical protein